MIFDNLCVTFHVDTVVHFGTLGISTMPARTTGKICFNTMLLLEVVRSIPQNIRTAVFIRSVQKTKSEYFLYETSHWLIRALLCSHHELLKRFSENL